MSLSLYLICLFQYFFYYTEDYCDDRTNNTENTIRFTIPKNVTDNIYLYYYYGPTLHNKTVFKLKDGLNVTAEPYFDVNRTTVFYFHGWGENATVGSAATISSALLKVNISNVVAFNYDDLVRGNEQVFNYIISIYNATLIGQAIGEFFKSYIPKYQSENVIKLISHSIGAQIMAKVARTYGIGKLPRLTGLDPAGPFYNVPGIKKLDKKDGKFVDIVHTDAGLFGTSSTIGTVDFFPNRGVRSQPGCSENIIDLASGCSHSRSYQYYAESILNSTAFLAKQCNRGFFFTYYCCNANSTAYMGYYVKNGTTGTYFLQTNSKPPYGEGTEGINF